MLGLSWCGLDSGCPLKFMGCFIQVSLQAFSQDSKRGRPNCTIGPAQMNNL